MAVPGLRSARAGCRRRHSRARCRWQSLHRESERRRAERLCPGGIFITPDFTRYRDVSKSVKEIFKRHTDLIEPLSLDEAYLGVTENKIGLPTATLVAKTIRQQIRDELTLTASAGVAPNKFLAKLASDWKKPDGLFVIQPGEVDAFLLPQPVGRLPGVGKVTEEKLTQLGIKTVGELRSLERGSLERSVRPLRYPPLRTCPRHRRKSGRPRSIYEVHIRRGYISRGCAARRDRTHDPTSSREALVCLAAGIACATYCGSQTENQ